MAIMKVYFRWADCVHGLNCKTCQAFVFVHMKLILLPTRTNPEAKLVLNSPVVEVFNQYNET